MRAMGKSAGKKAAGSGLGSKNHFHSFAGSHGGKIPSAAIHRAPIMTLFFIWRLHGKPRHPYFLITDMRGIGITQCKPSTVYALLSKMEKAGLVESHIDTGARRVRRLYQTTKKGWSLLSEIKAKKMRGTWREFVEFLVS